MKREGHLYEKLISDENLRAALFEVNKTHRWFKNHQPNMTVEKIESDTDGYVNKLRAVIEGGFIPGKVKIMRRWDKSAGKWRDISEPKLWPDQYVHHALIQVLEPVMMRGMDEHCCGSIRGRGIRYGQKAISKWINEDAKGTKYCLELDIHHFYESLEPKVVLERFRHLIKDTKILSMIENINRDGILIGAYCSQWFANTVLQPLDHIIRESGLASHYLRYMDNFTIFGPNKRKLRKLFGIISAWLNEHELQPKDNWQVFPTRTRLPSALGFRYGKGYTLLRKRNLLRLKRQLSRLQYKREHHKFITANFAAGLLSRIGQLKYTNSTWFFKCYAAKGLQKFLKNIVRKYQRMVKRNESIKLDVSTCIYA